MKHLCVQLLSMLSLASFWKTYPWIRGRQGATLMNDSYRKITVYKLHCFVMAQQFFYWRTQAIGSASGILLCLNVLQKRGRKLLQVLVMVIVQDVWWDKDSKNGYMSRPLILVSKRALSYPKESHPPCAEVLLQWTIRQLHWGFLVAEGFWPSHQCLFLYILPWLWISWCFRICPCTLLITWTKAEVAFVRCKVLLP